MKIIFSLLVLATSFANPLDDELNRDKRGRQPTSGPLSVWYGESSIASVSSRSGIWNQDYKVENMFDENGGTCWHSEERYGRVAKTMRVDFRVRFKLKKVI